MMLRRIMLRRRMTRMIMLRKMRWMVMMSRTEDEVEDDDVEDDDVKGEEDDDVAVEEEEDDDVEEEDRSQEREAHFVRACAIEMHINMSQEPLYTENHRKNGSPQPRPTLCASLRSRNACQDLRPEYAQNADEHFVRTCAVETHVKISQEPLYTEIYRQNAADQMEHPDQAPAFTPTVRTPQCEVTVWGITGIKLLQKSTR